MSPIATQAHELLARMGVAKSLYTEGTLTVAHESGTAEADGTMPNGMIGGFVTGTFEGKPIAISFTAPVTEAEIDD